MRVECVHCGATGQMDETKIPPGVTSIKCPRCKESFPIPAMKTQADSSSSAGVEQKENGYSSTNQPSAPPPAQESPPASSQNAQQSTETLSPKKAETVTASCTVCSASFPRSEMVRFGGAWVCAACKPGYVQMLAQGKPRPGQMRYAGFWIRFGAKFLDGLILSVAGFLISMLVGLVISRATPETLLTSTAVSYVLQVAMAAAYSGYFLGTYRATPGKMACGLEVVSPEGNQISVMRGVGRYFGEWISSLILLIGYLMVLFDEEKRSLHDRICNTRVVYK